MSAGKCPMGQSLGMSRGTAASLCRLGRLGRVGRLGQAGQLGHSSRPAFRSPMIPFGSWPRRMTAEFAAAYCGEFSVGAFLKRVGKDYPAPRVAEGRRRLWLRDDLDSAILPAELAPARDVAADL